MSRRDQTPRDLLFGLLALQNGLIDQDQLVAAFSAWSRAKGRTLAEILLERGAIDEESRALLDGMAGKQLELHGGDTEKSLAAVAVGPSTREKLAGLGDTDLTASMALVGSQTPTRDATATVSIGSSTSGGQRFRVLRPHAQGGLGAVFVALDGELNREVALKQILDHHADDPTSRTRFVIEAEITGGLEHPGIVPVYGLGHYGDGRPYYAMRFIRGDSLKEAIAAFHADGSLEGDPGRKSLALRKLLRRFGDVCNAIEYAHSRGVLHRDVKPGNVIVGKHGETLVVDWGLAKPMGHAEPASAGDERTLTPSSTSGSAETLPGQAIGTPAYMSPEQAAGDLDKLGPRSDVYSLGATLYCLLTGRAPFGGSGLGEVLLAVRNGDFPPPRRVDPSIDRALEAVCLKAMATRPDDRHATARALADDVERWAADEPTSAWVEPLSVRARRWMRRNRSAVTAVAAAALVAMVGLSAVLAVQAQANEILMAKNVELDKANRLKDQANANLVEANARVQARFDLAREAIRSFQDGVNEDDMLKGEELKGLRNKLLRSAAGFHEKLEKLLQGQADRPSRAILAQSYFNLGELTEKIGVKPEALAVHRKALAIRRELAAGPGADVGLRLELARSLLAAGMLAQATGDNAGALAACEEARGLADPLAVGPAATHAARDALGTSHLRIGNVLKGMGKTTEAMESYRRALAIRRALAEDDPGVNGYRTSLADVHNEIGRLRSVIGLQAEALESYRQSLTIRRELAEEYPAVTEFRMSLADSHDNIGFLLSETGRPAEAMESYDQALAIRRKLSEEHPAVTVFRQRLANTYHNIGYLKARNGRPAEASESYRQAFSLFQKLADDHPAVTDFRSGLADVHNEVGIQHSMQGRPDEAIEAYRRALAIRQGLADDNPTVPEFRSRLAIAHNNVGILLNRPGRTDEALESHRRALAIRQRLADEHPAITNYRHFLANSHANTADVLLGLGRFDDARDGYARAIEIREKLVEANPTVTMYRFILASNVQGLGLARAGSGDLGGARLETRRGLALLEALPHQSGWELFDLACARSTLAGLAARGAPGSSAGEAATEADRAMDLLHRAVAEGFRGVDKIRGEESLEPLHARPDFRLLMMDLTFPADPFAR